MRSLKGKALVLHDITVAYSGYSSGKRPSGKGFLLGKYNDDYHADYDNDDDVDDDNDDDGQAGVMVLWCYGGGCGG